MFFGPFMFLYFIFFLFFLCLVFVLVQLGIISYVFEKIGIGPQQVFLLLFASLIGSYINIPVARLEGQPQEEKHVVSYFGLRFRIPMRRLSYTVLAVNVGGAVIPALISIYLLSRFGHFLQAFIATLVVTLVVNRLARPVRGMGIAVPIFIPPLVAALVALLLGGTHAPQVAYISGTLGTLLGADLLNLNKIRGLGAPVASIGGAGTFDGIFITGIIAVLLA